VIPTRDARLLELVEGVEEVGW